AADGTLSLIQNPNFNPAAPAGVSNSRFLYGGTSQPGFELFNPNDPDPARRGRVLVDGRGQSFINPVAARIARDFFPAPNLTNPADVINQLGANYAYFRRTQYNDDRYTFRLDHRLNDHHLLYGRYTYQPQFGNRFERDIIQHGLISDANRSRQILAVWTWTPEPTSGGSMGVNEFRVNYVYGDFGRNFPEPLLNRDYTSEYLNIGGAGQGAVNLLGYGMARFFDGGALKSATGQTSGAGIASAGFNSPQDVGKNREHSYSLTDDYSWTRGSWTMKLGFSASYLQLNQANLGVGSLAGGRFSWDGNYLGEKNCTSNPIGGNLPDCSGAVLGGDKFASFLLGVPSWAQVQTENLSIPYYYRWQNFGGYTQNDVRINPNLTFNVGLRYQYQSPRWEKFNRQGQLNLDRMEPNPFVRDAAGNALPAPVFEYAGFNGRSRYLTPPQYNVLEPRFGFAWVPGFGWNKDRKFVLRGGYGITHGTLMGNDREPIPNIGSQTFSQFRSLSYLLGSNDFAPPSNSATCGLARCAEIGVPMQFGYNNMVLASDPKMFNLPESGEIRPGDAADVSSSRGVVRQDVRYQATGVVADKNFRMPTIQNYSLLVQYEFMRQTVLTFGYQGSRGTHLFGAPQNVNRVDPFSGAVPIPGFSGRLSNSIYLLDPTNAASTYHAFTSEVERRFTNGLQFRVNYTWSRNIDDNSGGVKFSIPNNSFANASYAVPLTRAQNPYDSRSERAPAASDTPHILNAFGFLDLPFGEGRKWLNGRGWYQHILGNWQLSGIGRIRSGYPLTATLGQGNSLDTGLPGGALRPDIISGVSLVNPDWTPRNAQFTNYLNPRAFSWPEPGQYGNSARNYSVARLPWVQTLDMSITKRIRPWKESRRYFELRAEAFNVLNHRTFETNINNTNLFSQGGQNTLLAGNAPFQTPVAGRVENRNRNLTAPGVWDAIIARSTGTPTDTAIAALPGPGAGGTGCPTNAPELNTQTAALSPACVARSLSLNQNFYRLNQNTVSSRIIQFALRFNF
ncbi:MAG: TonB-dependent receptor, partial [Bryobacteraceae bacterium]|nr:TonB-dependent receptor [Bryobacteraceae bacterium]